MIDHQQQLQRLQSGFRSTVFDGLYTDSVEQRAIALDNVVNLVRGWASISFARQSSSIVATPGEETELLLRHHLLIILRMSINCPFSDVRQRFAALLLELRQSNVRVPRPIHESPSFFIAKDRLVRLGEESPLARRVMTSGFIASGRFSNVFRLMIYFPSFLERFFATFHRAMRLQGPLPRHWRNYIAIMGACQHKCQYLASLQQQEFLQNGGDPVWLQGLDKAPLKLQALAQLNTLLAHQPWRVTKDHVSSLIRGPGGGDSNWSKSELVQAMVVLTSFHSLASFVLGCGVTPEIDMAGGAADDDNGVIPDDRLSVNIFENEEIEEYTAELLQRLKSKNRYEKEEAAELTAARQEVFQNCDTKETFMSTLRKPSRFEHPSPDNRSAELLEQQQQQQQRQQSPLPATGNHNSNISACNSNYTINSQSINTQYEDLERFTSGSGEIKHVDFDFKSNEYTIFRLQDYNWEEHGCSLVSKYLPETGELLDEEFSEILNLTDYSIFTTSNKDCVVQQQDKVDTWPFRQAVWYYVLRLAGMSHDDYDYHEVNIYLNKRIKLYIKKVACYPETVVALDFHNMGFNFRPDEKCQINLLAAEARRCAELLYGLHALMKFDGQ